MTRGFTNRSAASYGLPLRMPKRKKGHWCPQVALLVKLIRSVYAVGASPGRLSSRPARVASTEPKQIATLRAMVGSYQAGAWRVDPRLWSLVNNMERSGSLDVPAGLSFQKTSANLPAQRPPIGPTEPIAMMLIPNSAAAPCQNRFRDISYLVIATSYFHSTQTGGAR